MHSGRSSQRGPTDLAGPFLIRTQLPTAFGTLVPPLGHALCACRLRCLTTRTWCDALTTGLPCLVSIHNINCWFYTFTAIPLVKKKKKLPAPRFELGASVSQYRTLATRGQINLLKVYVTALSSLMILTHWFLLHCIFYYQDKAVPAHVDCFTIN